MKRIAFVIVAATLLTACEVSISVRPGVTVGAFQTDYAYNGRFVVCNDRTTTFTYVLNYPSPLRSFNVYLEGYSSGRIRHVHSVSLSERERWAGRYERSFSVRSHIAPLGAEGELDIQPAADRVQAIVVNPREPRVVGRTILVIETQSGGRLSSQPISVLDFCGG